MGGVDTIFAEILVCSAYFCDICKDYKYNIMKQLLLATTLLTALSAHAESDSDTLFVYMKGGGFNAFPTSMIDTQTTENEHLVVRTVVGSEFSYPLAEVESTSYSGPAEVLPSVTSFTIKSKYNDEVFEDVNATVTDDSVITASVPSIGRWLTPSFELSDASASAYIGGIKLKSNVSRNSYRNSLRLVVARPDELVLTQTGGEGAESLALLPYGRSYSVIVDWPADRSTNVPRMDIDIEGGQMVSSKDVYLSAKITIDGAGVFPSMKATDVQIKGRGNTSWSSNPWDKNPYRLKFVKKQTPFGLAKAKSWVLQANKQSRSMMANAVGMKIARMVNTAAANHVIPVELYINGNYRGSYVFTEKVGISANSVEVDDETVAVLLELDTYYDEAYKFKTDRYRLPVNIKSPDFSEDETSLTFDNIKDDFNKLTNAMYRKEDMSSLLDVDMLARYLMVNDLIVNYEIQHPKSTYVYKADLTDPDSKYVFGPVWDLDWAFGYESNGNYCTTDQKVDFWTAKSSKMENWTFMRDLRYNSGEAVDKAYYKVWTGFMNDRLQEVIDFSNDYYNYAKPSFEHNATMWSDGRDYASITKNMTSWIETRANHVYSGLTPYDLTEPDDPVVDGIATVGAGSLPSNVDVYSLSGVLLRRAVPLKELRGSLPAGIYIVNGKKLKI